MIKKKPNPVNPNFAKKVKKITKKAKKIIKKQK